MPGETAIKNALATLLDKTAEQTFRLSKNYDIGGGKPGFQQAIFEILVKDEGAL